MSYPKSQVKKLFQERSNFQFVSDIDVRSSKMRTEYWLLIAFRNTKNTDGITKKKMFQWRARDKSLTEVELMKKERKTGDNQK